MQDETIVDIQNFTMKFGDKVAVKDLSFQVFRGEVFGFLGSNGSGKTTTLRALFGLYDPTSGKLLIDGRPYAVDSDIKVGYLPEERGLYKKEKVLDVMLYFGQLKGMSRSDARKFCLEYLERVGLSDKMNMKIDKLSGGQQQKIQLGVTVMGNPDLLILDEPTKGFDPVNRRLLMNIIEEQRDAGATIIFVTHQMEEAERLCSRLVLLKNGQSVAYGTMAEIKKRYKNESLDDIFVKLYGGELSEEEI